MAAEVETDLFCEGSAAPNTTSTLAICSAAMVKFVDKTAIVPFAKSASTQGDETSMVLSRRVIVERTPRSCNCNFSG